MKTKIKILFGLVALFMFVAKGLNAQTCVYNVHNTLNCSADVTVEYFDGGTTPCNTFNATLAPNTTQMFNCGSCGTIVNVKVTLLSVAGMSATASAWVDAGTQNAGPLYSGTLPSACSNSNDAYLSWAISDTAIIP